MLPAPPSTQVMMEKEDYDSKNKREEEKLPAPPSTQVMIEKEDDDSKNKPVNGNADNAGEKTVGVKFIGRKMQSCALPLNGCNGIANFQKKSCRYIFSRFY